MASQTVLIVEDNSLVRDSMAEALLREGYTVATASTAAEMLEKMPAARPDIILLDLVLPDADGLSLIGKIREYTDVPVLIVSGKVDMVDKVVGLEMGADDYIGKPIQPKELNARIRAHLRRYNGLTATAAKPARKEEAIRIKIGRWLLDRPKLQIYDDAGTSGDLTVKEFRLLEALALQPNCVLSREQILDKARDGDYNTTDRAIDVQIVRIRKKLGDNASSPEIIKSVRGVGYILAAKTEILE
ncbi:MAG: response regulator transcription factor [Alphaproteobacteria bacterium]|nr:response regulator transcription factor [Alphaproteobacteria bacterium]